MQLWSTSIEGVPVNRYEFAAWAHEVTRPHAVATIPSQVYGKVQHLAPNRVRNVAALVGLGVNRQTKAVHPVSCVVESGPGIGKLAQGCCGPRQYRLMSAPTAQQVIERRFDHEMEHLSNLGPRTQGC